MLSLGKRSGISDLPRLSPVKGRDVSLPKPPLLTLLEGGQYIFSRELVDSVRAHVQDPGDFPAVQKLLFSFHHTPPPSSDDL